MQVDERLFDPKSFFKEVVEKKRVASCYLFVGDDEPQKIETARYLARLLNCHMALQDEGCTCSSCIKTENLSHPDVTWIKPALGEGLKIESIRGISRKIYLKPYEGKWKVFIIEDAQCLTEEAQNAFLKTLEEPPGDSVIILMTAQKELLLNTITSRCQIVKFLSAASKEEIDAFVRDFILSERRLESLGEFTKKVSRQELDGILNSSLVWFRDALACKTGEENLCRNKEDIIKVRETASRYSYDKLEDIIKNIIYLKSISRRNVNPKIAISVLALALEG